MINKAILVGRVGKDPETRHLESGKQVTNFTLATSEKYKDKEETTWHNIVIWGKLSEVADQYVKKGDLLYIEGKTSNSSYESDGVKRYVTEIVAYSMQMLGGKKSESNSSDEIPY